MKKLFLSLVSFVLATAWLGADQASLAVQKLLYGRAAYSLEEQVTIEKYELQIIEEELAYLNNILALKAAVNQLYETGNITEIKKGFSQRSEELNKLLAEQMLSESQLSLNEQQIIYAEIPEIRDQLLWNQAQVAYQQKKYKQAQSYLEEIINSYPSSPGWQEAYVLLSGIYFEQQLNSELVNLIENYNVEKTELLTFQSANALFNLEKYSRSKTEFDLLLPAEDYALQSQGMLALIAYFTGDVESAADQLQLILQEDDISRQMKNFALLNLGRIYLLQESEFAWTYFDEYYKINNQINDNILYELAGYYFQAQRFQQAKTMLNTIVTRTPKSRFYVSASFMLTITSYYPDDQSQAEAAVDSLMQTNQELLENVASKNFFLDKYEKILEQLTSIDSSDMTYENLSYQLDLIEFELSEIDQLLSGFYRGSADRKLTRLYVLEEEYKNYLSILADIRALILVAQQMPRENFARYLNSQIAFADSSLITLQVVKYLRARPLITPQDYRLARSLAAEKILLQSQLAQWQSLQQLAELNQNFSLLEKIQSYQDLMQTNIAGFDRIADYIFNYSASQDYDQYLNQEVAAIESNRQELFDLSRDIKDSFDNLVSRKLKKEQTALLSEFTELSDDYNAMLDVVENDIELENKEYEYQLLNILFENSQRLDNQYQELQKKLVDQDQDQVREVEEAENE
ncbi:MAG: tetratricopeptide repeat protein [Candidatus Cloacimonetes bacterium]|nr:tetratricopeptide repeat protein [Candidatus Cloacimonadota bacterium]MCF7814447.1 tetratricopeptide repeat protein [Candidatus Cloacimonadota bacterium]MCF7868797.1 tetratricopeptide repeat protein [Candidatus Cloacimonadota bacterium]